MKSHAGDCLLVVCKSKRVKKKNVQRETIICPSTHHPPISSCIAQSSWVMALVCDRFLASEHHWQAPALQVTKQWTCNALLSKALTQVHKVMHKALCWEKKVGGGRLGAWPVVNCCFVLFLPPPPANPPPLRLRRFCVDTIQAKCICTSSPSAPGPGASGGSG